MGNLSCCKDSVELNILDVKRHESMDPEGERFAKVGFGLFSMSRQNESNRAEPLSLALPELMPVIAVPSSASEEKRVILSDGSRLTMAPGATLEVIENSGKRFETALLKGWVRFSVTPGRERTWVIDAGLTRVHVIGTQFTVNRTPRAVKVAVHRGTVRLHPKPSPGKVIELTAGESRRLSAPYRDADSTSTTPSRVASTDSSLFEEVRPLADTSSKCVRTLGRPLSHKPRRPESPMADLAGMGSSEPVNALLREVDEARK